MTTQNYPIIVLPGVFDSKLYYDKACTKPAWPIKGSSEVMALAHSSGVSTLLHKYARADFYVKEPVNDTTDAIKEYGPHDVFKDLCVTLQNAFPERDVWFFSYDFRQFSSVSAKRLAAFLDTFDTPVDIVCHSYGNNLLAAYLSANGPDKIHRAACLAPPFEGSFDVFLVPPRVGLFPCLTELAPAPALLAQDPVTLNAEPVDADAYKRLIDDFFGGPYTPADYSAIAAHPGIHFAAGIDRFTPQRAAFKDDGEGVYVDDMAFNGAGDGTVPLASADLLGKLTDKLTYFEKMGHSDFAREPRAWTWAVMQLNSGEPPLYRPAPEIPDYIRLRVSGTSDVVVRKAHSTETILSPLKTPGPGAASLVVGKNRDVTIIALAPQDCAIEIYASDKHSDVTIAVSRCDGTSCTQTHVYRETSMAIRMTLSKDGTLSEPIEISLAHLSDPGDLAGLSGAFLHEAESDAEHLIADAGSLKDALESKFQQGASGWDDILQLLRHTDK